MRGALKARRDRYEADRDLALMTAFFTAQLSRADWKASRIPPRFSDWLAQMTNPQPVSAGDRIARFKALQEQGFDVQVTTRH